MAKAARKMEQTETKVENGNAVPVPIEMVQLPARSEPVSVEIDRYRGVSQEPVPSEARKRLLAPIEATDVEIRPDGVLYYPEIKYRKVLNEAIGPGGWALVPRSEISMDSGRVMSQQWALFILGRFASEARGEQEYFESNPQMTYPSAVEGVKSNALMRCCKDLGIASELWDPNFIEGWLDKYAVQVWVEERNKPQWRRKDRKPFYREKGLVDKGGASLAKGAPQQNYKRHPFTESHKRLQEAIKGYIEQKAGAGETLPDDVEQRILIRITAWTDKDGKAHEGVEQWDRISEKMATYALKKFNEAVKKKAQNGKQGGK